MGMYSACLADGDCMNRGIENPDCVAFTPRGESSPTDGFCTAKCIAASDPSACEEGADGDAVPKCVQTQSGAHVCALDCAEEKTCPTGMECVYSAFVGANEYVCM